MMALSSPFMLRLTYVASNDSPINPDDIIFEEAVISTPKML